MKNEINKPEKASGAPDVHRGLQTVTIGGIRFENPYFLAPLAGITDAPFRRICRSFGAGAGAGGGRRRRRG